MSSSASSTEQDVFNAIRKLLSNTDDDNTRKIILRSIHVMAHILNEMMDELPNIECIDTAEGSELLALVVMGAVERGISIDDNSFK